jgi:hypothetical protein
MTEEMRYLTEKATSQLTSFALSTLRNHRFLGKGIPYIKVGRTVRYLRQDAIDYMESHKVRTADE